MGPLTRAVQTGIGLVAEIKAAKAEHKAAKSSAQAGSSDIIQEQSEQVPNLVEQVRLDEKRPPDKEEDSENDQHFGGAVLPSYQSQILTRPESDGDSPPPYARQELAAADDIEFPAPPRNRLSSKLQYPVIIPQRRPGSKIRGFVRAYAPVLADHDINQDTFLYFLKTFHKASQVGYQ